MIRVSMPFFTSASLERFPLRNQSEPVGFFKIRWITGFLPSDSSLKTKKVANFNDDFKINVAVQLDFDDGFFAIVFYVVDKMLRAAQNCCTSA